MAKKNLIKNLLRILTPEEIIELTKLNKPEGRRSLTELILKSFGKEMPATLRAAQNEKDGDKKAEESQVDKEIAVKELEENQDLKDSAAGEKSSSTEQKKGVVFILDIKEKMKGSQRALKEQEIIHLYEETSKVDIEQERGHKDDMKKSGAQGVLVNKRQF